MYIEPSEIKNSAETILQIPKAAFENEADRILRDLLPGYDRKRTDGTVQRIQACLLQPSAQLAYRDRRMYLQKTAPDQIKPVHLPDSPVAKRFFDALRMPQWK